MKEIWKDIPDFVGIYQVSNFGNVRSLDRIEKWMQFIRPRRGRNLKPYIDKYGYPTVVLKGRRFTIHRIVAKVFLTGSGNQVNHKNGIKTDNRPENLEYCTAAHNVKHSWDSGLCKKQLGRLHHHSKPVVAIKDVSIIEFECIRECAEYIGVSITSVFSAAKRNGKSGGFSIYYL